jgi:hypothetical protein
MLNFSVECSVRNIACITFCLQLDSVFLNSVIVDITSFCLFVNMMSIKSHFCQDRSTNFCDNVLLTLFYININFILLFILILSRHVSLMSLITFVYQLKVLLTYLLTYIVTDNAANMQGWARDRDVSVSRRLETHPGSRLGLVSNRTANVSVSSRSRRPTSRVSSRSRAQTSRSRLGLEILGLEPIPGAWYLKLERLLTNGMPEYLNTSYFR